MSTKNGKTVSLVLGSGGARGLAHIGVIHWLQEHEFNIQSISGCSMGALVGGIYAADKLDDYEQWVRVLKKVDIFTLLDLSWGKSGLVKGDKIINTLINLVGDMRIEDLPISFTAVAVDISCEKEVWIQSGRLFDAIRASISLPLFFTPFDYKGATFIDGGVLNPVPIAPTFRDETDMTIAVNLGGTIEHLKNLENLKPVPKKTASMIQKKISNFITRFHKTKKPDIARRDWGAYNIVSHAFEAMQSTIARQKLAAYPPDHTIEIAKNACGTLEFDRASVMIDLGYEKAREALEKLI